MKMNIIIIKGLRIFFTIGTIIIVLGAIINGVPIYVPLGLIFGGSTMVWFMGKRMNALKGLDETGLSSGDHNISKSNDKKKIKKMIKRFFDIVAIVMILMVLSGAIAAKDISVVIVFIPIIFIFWLVSSYMLK